MKKMRILSKKIHFFLLLQFFRNIHLTFWEKTFYLKLFYFPTWKKTFILVASKTEKVEKGILDINNIKSY